MITYGWGDYEKSYVVLSFNGHWTMEEFAHTIMSLQYDFKSINRTINLIVDLRHSAVPPTSIMSIASRAIGGRSLNIGRIIIISKTLLWKRLYEAITHTHPNNGLDIHFVDAVDKTYQLLMPAESIS